MSRFVFMGFERFFVIYAIITVYDNLVFWVYEFTHKYAPSYIFGCKSFNIKPPKSILALGVKISKSLKPLDDNQGLGITTITRRLV